MTNVVLTHPVYGAKVASNETEIAMDEKNGWVRYNVPTPVEAAPVERATITRKYTRKVTEQPIEQPNEVPPFMASVSDESEGK
jgi:hypothetical protein